VPAFTDSVVPPGAMSSHPQPTLVVDELTLRPWLPEDAAALVAAYGDPGVQRWHIRSVTEVEAPQWISDAQESWTAETAANWAVIREGTLVGRMKLQTSIFFGLGLAAYWVVPVARGLGVAPRALGEMTAWGFALGLHRIELEHSVANDASCRVALKAGYALESTKRSQALHADGWHDIHLHVRIATD